MKRAGRLAGGVALLALLAGGIGIALATAVPTPGTVPAAAAPATVPPRPLLWKLSDKDNDVYLLGSFHALKPGDYPLAASVDAAFADAELVAFEIPPEEMTSPALGAQMMAAAIQPQGHNLQQSLNAGEWRRLETWARKRDLPLQNLQALEPWFVSLIISLGEMERIGYDPKQGLDQQLIKRAAEAHKRTMGLETGASQIAVLDGMSASEQRQSLAEALDDAADFETRMNTLHELWRKGDDAGLTALLTVEFKNQYGQLYQRVNVDRNQAWIPQIQRLLDEPHQDDALVVVGSMHMLGPDGLVSQLRARGYRVQRL